MSTTNSAKLEHLEWAVESRARNQRSAVRLLKLFRGHEARWKTRKWARAAQDLLSVSFSLWRAAFLADKSGQRSDVFAGALEFLEKIIEDNAISYPQDRKCRDWTFNYYTRNARASLEVLAEHWPDHAPEYQGKTRSATERWEYCQDLLDEAITGFEKLARDLQAKETSAKKARETRTAAKERRKKSRAVTLAQRVSTTRNQ